MLADMATDLDAARMLTLKAADSRGRQIASDAVTLAASMAKLFASEAAHRAADKAMQILASRGYRRGSVVERLFRDVRATKIYQGLRKFSGWSSPSTSLAWHEPDSLCAIPHTGTSDRGLRLSKDRYGPEWPAVVPAQLSRT